MKMKSFLLLLLLSTLLNVSANQPPCGTWLNNSTLIVLESGTFSLSTQLLNPRYVSSIQFGGLKLRITNIGSIEIIEISNNRQVWSWGRTNINCTNSCKATFQSDGNFVLYYPDNQGVISTKTYNGAASYIYLTTQPPYFQLFNYTCEVVWPGSRGQPTFGPIARSTQDPSQNPVVLPFYHTTIPAARFKEYFGVCTHLSHGWSASLVTSLAPFVGTSTIRDGIPNANQYAAYKAAVDAGLKINFLFGGPSNISGLQDQINRILTLVNNYDVPISSINNFEGFNELNNFGFTYNGINPATSYTGMAEAMKDLYLLIKSTPQFNGIRVYDLTAASFGPDAADAGLLNYSGRADYANIHAYPYKGAPGYYASRNIFYEGMNGEYPTFTVNTPRVITETGYYTLLDGKHGVSEIAQSKMQINLLLNGLLLGFEQMYLYELYDESWNAPNNPEEHFGLFRHDRTPKPIAYALHWLSLILNDTVPSTSSQATSHTLIYALSGLPITAQHQLFYRYMDSTYIIVVWNNIPVWDNSAQKELTPPQPVQVTLDLDHVCFRSITVYDIYATTDPITTPLHQVNTASSLQFSFSDTAIVIAVEY